MFIAAQFTIAKIWKQPKCPSVDKWIKKTVGHLHNGILHSRKKEGAPTFHDNMDGTGEHCAKWNKPGWERQISYDLTYSRNLVNKTNDQNKSRGMETRNKLTAVRGEWEGGLDERRWRDQPQNIYPKLTDTGISVMMARRKGGRNWVEGNKEGRGNWDICNSVLIVNI